MGAGPLVSVIINAYNGARYLREAIESVYGQSLQDFEIVLFDDASTDATPDIARSFDHRLRYARSERLVPLGEARNRALELSRGKFLSFLDQDDIYLPRKLEKQVARFQEDVALVFCNSIRFWEKTGREALLYAYAPAAGHAFRALLRRYYLAINTVAIRKDAVPQERQWWFPASFCMCEEVDLFLRLAYRHRIAYIDEPLAKYRIHSDNWSIRRPELLVSEQNAIIARLRQLIPSFEADYADELAEYRSQIKRVEGQIFWKNSRRREALSAYWESLRLHPNAVSAVEMVLSAGLPYQCLPALREWLGKPI